MAGRVGIPLRVALGPVSLLGRPSHQGQPRMFWKRGSLCPDQGWDMVLLWKMRMGFSASPPHPLKGKGPAPSGPSPQLVGPPAPGCSSFLGRCAK